MRMKMNRRIFTLGAATATAMLLGSCGPTPQLKVKEAMLTLSPVDSNPSSYALQRLWRPGGRLFASRQHAIGRPHRNA